MDDIIYLELDIHHGRPNRKQGRSILRSRIRLRHRQAILCCRKDWFDEGGVHFDLNHYNIIVWEDAPDLLLKLTARIKATII